jgi:hypothetical protein
LINSKPIGHALKIELQHQWYYGLKQLQPKNSMNQGRCQYVWPSTGSDAGSEKVPNGKYSGTLQYLAPGALLAIPSHLKSFIEKQMKTRPGNKILKAFIDYGAYIVDDTGRGNSAAICMEADVNSEMRSEYGYTMTYPSGVTNNKNDPGRHLYQDLLLIFQNLHVVVNNKLNSIGGGGIPRVPTKSPICGEKET